MSKNKKDRFFGLIGYPLSHSFSKGYFTQKFADENITDASYDAFELKNIEELPALLEKYPQLRGLNVTIPYKNAVIPFLDELEYSAQEVGAVNVIKVTTEGKKIGFNSDYYGFLNSLKDFIPPQLKPANALILGDGGAAKAVKTALKTLHIAFTVVSRTKEKDKILYDAIDEQLLRQTPLIINTTPLGMYPNIENCPPIPYTLLNQEHYLYDLIYNPEKTLFMEKGEQQGAKVKNGLEMLILQAEKSWEIWNS